MTIKVCCGVKKSSVFFYPKPKKNPTVLRFQPDYGLPSEIIKNTEK